jgi:hypothetical protein
MFLEIMKNCRDRITVLGKYFPHVDAKLPNG